MANDPSPTPATEAPEWIVGEASKSWPNDDLTPVSELFERVVTMNWNRGYAVHSMALAQTLTPDGKAIIETIVAVFRRADPSVPYYEIRGMVRGKGEPWRERPSR